MDDGGAGEIRQTPNKDSSFHYFKVVKKNLLKTLDQKFVPRVHGNEVKINESI